MFTGSKRGRYTSWAASSILKPSASKHSFPTTQSTDGLCAGDAFGCIGGADRRQKRSAFCSLVQTCLVCFHLFRQPQMHTMHPRGLRTHSKLYNCVFMGERSQDAGGPYRESWSMYAQELQVRTCHACLLSGASSSLRTSGRNPLFFFFPPLKSYRRSFFSLCAAFLVLARLLCPSLMSG